MEHGCQRPVTEEQRSQTTRGAENPPGGRSFARGQRWLGVRSPLRGCAHLAALPTAKTPRRSNIRNFQTGSKKNRGRSFQVRRDSPRGLGVRRPSGAFPRFPSGGGPPQSRTLARNPIPDNPPHGYRILETAIDFQAAPRLVPYCASQPPSTARDVPVINGFSNNAMTANATSSVVPMRPIGWALASQSRCGLFTLLSPMKRSTMSV